MSLTQQIRYGIKKNKKNKNINNCNNDNCYYGDDNNNNNDKFHIFSCNTIKQSIISLNVVFKEFLSCFILV